VTITLRCPVVAVANVPANRGRKQHRHLVRKTKNSEQRGGTRQLVDQPELRRRLHPRAISENELSRDEQLKIAVLHRAESALKTTGSAWTRPG